MTCPTSERWWWRRVSRTRSKKGCKVSEIALGDWSSGGSSESKHFVFRVFGPGGMAARSRAESPQPPPRRRLVEAVHSSKCSKHRRRPVLVKKTKIRRLSPWRPRRNDMQDTCSKSFFSKDFNRKKHVKLAASGKAGDTSRWIPSTSARALAWIVAHEKTSGWRHGGVPGDGTEHGKTSGRGVVALIGCLLQMFHEKNMLWSEIRQRCPHAHV